MEIIEPSVFVRTSIDRHKIYGNLERSGRVAYKSEDMINLGSAEKFLSSIIKSGHESVLEHESISVLFICDRGVTHELVRHRLAAYTQESTRYVNYYKKGMQFIKPCFWDFSSREYKTWCDAMKYAERTYNYLMANGATPQEARSVLPNSLKTEIVATANIREWRHILRLRTAPNAHPQMRQIMCILLDELRASLPVLFGDIIVNT